MDDLISRKAAIVIAHDLLIKDKDDYWQYNQAITDYAIKLTSLPPSEQSVIRCKDCKYMTEHYDTDGNAPYWTCSEWDSGTDYDGFCHYAERREQ